jgi:hypothetical protein
MEKVAAIFDFFTNESMLQNITAEMFGIVVTVVCIDTLYEYRQKRQRVSYEKVFVDVVKTLVRNSIDKFFIGAGLDSISTLDAPKRARNLATIIVDLCEYLDRIEDYMGRYSVLASPKLLSVIHGHIEKIDQSLFRLSILYSSQVSTTEHLNADDSLPKNIFVDISRFRRYKILDSLGSVPPDSSIGIFYKRAKDCYCALDKQLDALLGIKVTIWDVLVNDSLISGLCRFFKRDPTY